MVMNAPMITVHGWVGADVRHFPARDGSVAYSSFRIGVTPRFLDRTNGGFRDGVTEWFTVKTWRQTADNVAESLRRGDPVVVTGRFSSGQWADQDGVPHTELVIEAVALGPDLTRSVAHPRKLAMQRPGETLPAGPVNLTGATELPDGPNPPAQDAFVAEGGHSPDEPPADLDELIGAGDPFAVPPAGPGPASDASSDETPAGDGAADDMPSAPGRGRPALAGRR